MLIGIDASRANKPNKTGTEWYSYHLIQEFKKLDEENQFFLYSNSPLQNKLGDCPDNFQEKVLNWPLKKFWTWLRLSYEMLLAQGKPDVLFVPAHALPLFCAKKNVVTIHDVGFREFPEIYPKADIWYHEWAVHHAKKKADAIITVSEFSKEKIIEYYKIEPDRIFVTHLGYDKDFRVINDEQKLQEVLGKYGIDSEYLFYIGRLEEKKNVVNLVKAFGDLNREMPSFNLKLVLVGRPGHGFEKIEKEIKEYGLAGKVIMPGWVEQSDLPYLMNSAKAYVFPSLYEGFGIPVLEAMACATPVLCSNVCSLPEVAGNAAVFLTPAIILISGKK